MTTVDHAHTKKSHIKSMTGGNIFNSETNVNDLKASTATIDTLNTSKLSAETNESSITQIIAPVFTQESYVQGNIVSKRNDCIQKFIKYSLGTGIASISAIKINDSRKTKEFVYVAGVAYHGLMPVKDFSNTKNDSNELYSLFIAKLDKNGNQIYFKTAGTNSKKIFANKITNFVILQDDYVFLTGIINADLKLNSKDFSGTPISHGGLSCFITGLDKDGEQIFFKTMGSNSPNICCEGLCLSVTSIGLTYLIHLIGYAKECDTNTSNTPVSNIKKVYSLKDFEGGEITGYNKYNVFICEFDLLGTQSFIKLLKSDVPFVESSFSISEIKDSIVLSGIINSSINFKVNEHELKKGNNLFIMKLGDVTGITEFIKFAISDFFDSNDLRTNIKCVRDKIYLTSTFKSSFIDFNNTKKDVDGIVGFLMELTKDGVQKRIFYYPNIDEKTNIYVDVLSDNDLYISGTISKLSIDKSYIKKIFIAKIGSNGQQIFFKTCGGNIYNKCSGLHCINDNSFDNGIYITGVVSAENNLEEKKQIVIKDFDNNSVNYHAGRINIVICKIDKDGKQIYFKLASPIDAFIRDDPNIAVLINDNHQSLFISSNYNGLASSFNDFKDLAYPKTGSVATSFISRIDSIKTPLGIAVKDTVNKITMTLLCGLTNLILKPNTTYYWDLKTGLTEIENHFLIGVTTSDGVLIKF